MNLYKVTIRDKDYNAEPFERLYVVDTHEINIATSRIADMVKYSYTVIGIKYIDDVMLESRTELEMNSGMIAATRKALDHANDQIEALAPAYKEATRLIEEERADNDALRAVLEKHEWVNDTTYGEICPDCRSSKSEGHAPGCEIDRLLKKEKT